MTEEMLPPSTLRGKFLAGLTGSQNSVDEIRRSGRYKYLAIRMHEPARQRARELANTPEFTRAQRQRKKVEALFAELKNQIALRRVRLGRLKLVREQFLQQR